MTSICGLVRILQAFRLTSMSLVISTILWSPLRNLISYFSLFTVSIGNFRVSRPCTLWAQAVLFIPISPSAFCSAGSTYHTNTHWVVFMILGSPMWSSFLSSKSAQELYWHSMKTLIWNLLAVNKLLIVLTSLSVLNILNITDSIIVWISPKGDSKTKNCVQGGFFRGGRVWGVEIILRSMLKGWGGEAGKVEDTINGVFMSRVTGIQPSRVASEKLFRTIP